jgi:hypothetical protein
VGARVGAGGIFWARRQFGRVRGGAWQSVAARGAETATRRQFVKFAPDT